MTDASTVELERPELPRDTPTHRGTDVLAYVGDVALLLARTAVASVTRPFDVRETLRQLEVIGIRSLLIVVLTAVFSSLVMTVQTGVQLARFGALEYLGNVVTLTLVRELGPVLTALMVGGRVGSGIAAELGSMMVTEQVDAIRSMGADPVRRLVVPRVVATVVALPLLTTLAIVLGVAGTMVLCSVEYDIDPTYFRASIVQTVHLYDFIGGLVKTLFFGLFLGVIACHQGLATAGGTEGVGRSTTKTVVITSVVTLVSDFLLTSVLLAAGF